MPKCGKCRHKLPRIQENDGTKVNGKIMTGPYARMRASVSRPPKFLIDWDYVRTSRGRGRILVSNPVLKNQLAILLEIMLITKERHRIIEEKLKARAAKHGECSASGCGKSDGNTSKMILPTTKSTQYMINQDWGKRTELCSVLHINNVDNVWDVMRRGLFYEIKLWKNQYGHICCKASAKIKSKVNNESVLIEINTGDNFRKLLNLSPTEWSVLCESVEKANCSLYFNAFDVVNFHQMTGLQRLWYFLCKARHYIPDMCVYGKVSGTVKLMSQLKILPRIVVTDIRDHKGGEINYKYECF